MSSQLNVDSIVDKAGSGGTNVKIGNTSTYVSEGGAVTQNTVQGLCKSWLDLNGVSFGIQDSFNVSSATDNATGAFTTVLASNMANATYSESGIARVYHINTHTDGAKSTTGDKHQTFYVSGTAGQRTSHDLERSEVNYHGDLA